MTRSRRSTLFAAFVAAILAACAGNTDEERTGATSSAATGNHASDSTVTLCHFPPGDPGKMQRITVAREAAPALEAQGDGVCSAGASDCCLESGPTSLCTNLSTDTANCGACGTVCTAGQVCSNGACVCPAGESLCGGVCVDESSDASHCGGCFIRCAPGAACVGGSCACAAGETSCEELFGAACTNLQTDPNNCGACGNACLTENGVVCSAGACACPGGLTLCGNACLDPATDTLNTVPASLYVPLSGTAAVSGTEGVPSGAGCSALTTSPTSGTVIFSFLGMTVPVGVEPGPCSFSYAGFSSTLSATTSFDGDTYTCSEVGNGASTDKNSLCPELGTFNNGVSIDVSLKVTRSTGAVSITRTCTDAGSLCLAGTYLSGSILNLAGSLSCL